MRQPITLKGESTASIARELTFEDGALNRKWDCILGIFDAVAGVEKADVAALFFGV